MSWCLRQSGLPASVMGRHTWATWDPRRSNTASAALDACRGLVEQEAPERPWLVLEGVPGTGKTHLACATVGAAALSGTHAVYWTAPDLVTELYARLDARSLPELEHHLKTVPLLAIDDLGAEHSTSFVADVLHSVLDARYLDLRRTIITVNLGVPAFPARLASRLGDVMVVRVLRLEGGDARLEVRRA